MEDKFLYTPALLNGPKNVGKTVTLFWLYKKLSRFMKVKALSPKIIENNLENIDFKEYNVILLDLHELHTHSNCPLGCIVSMCQRNKVQQHQVFHTA